MQLRLKLATCLRSILFVLCFGLMLKSSYAQNYYPSSSCQLPDGMEATCVKLWECKSLRALLNTLKKPYTRAARKQLNVYKCNNTINGYGEICCPSGPIILDPPDVTNHPNTYLLPAECQILDDIDRITNGKNAKLNEFPWMALLQYETRDPVNLTKSIGFECGGTILNSNYILTAAHCVNTRLVAVRVGEHSIKNTTDCEVEDNKKRTIKCNPPVQDLRIEKMIPHHQFEIRGNTILNDIALLRVSTIKDAVNVHPVCLPLGALRDQIYKYVTVTGWGVINSTTHESADILQRADLSVMNTRTCVHSAPLDAIRPEICAKGKKKQAACAGDSGGPMMVVASIGSDPVFIQYGIVSRGPTYCEKSFSLYTNVKFYMDWILDHMEPYEN